MNKVSIKIMKITGLLHRIKHYVPCEILKLLYCSLVLPHFNYRNLVWGTETTQLLKLQKKAIRVVTNSKYNTHSEPLLKMSLLLN